MLARNARWRRRAAWQLSLVRSGNSPFLLDVNLLIREIEENLNAQVIDILTVNKGST